MKYKLICNGSVFSWEFGKYYWSSFSDPNNLLLTKRECKSWKKWFDKEFPSEGNEWVIESESVSLPL